MKARKRHRVGDPWPDYELVQEWYIVHYKHKHWTKLQFQAKPRDVAVEFQRLVTRKKLIHPVLWGKIERDERDAEDQNSARAYKLYGGKPYTRFKSPSHESQVAARQRYAALKRAHADGLSLWWINDGLRSRLEMFRPSQPVRHLFTDHGQTMSNEPSCYRVLSKVEEMNADGAWENSMRHIEDSR